MSKKVMTKKMAATLIAEKLTKQTGKAMTARKQSAKRVIGRPAPPRI
jgi:hypothetical protein